MPTKRDSIGHRLPKPLRIVRTHGRLFASFLIGTALFFAFPTAERLATRILIGWDVAVTVYLALAFVMVSRFDIALVRRRAATQDEGGTLILILTILAAIASLAAILAELGPTRGTDPAHWNFYVVHAVLTIALSWTFIHVVFAFHYAHEFYGEGRDQHVGGLEFPDDDQPNYWDFIYFSFVIGMTFQVSDVQVTSKLIRRLVVAHGIVSFVFNVAILALMVNISSELLK
jgi:uncharacterized membrane protein